MKVIYCDGFVLRDHPRMTKGNFQTFFFRLESARTRFCNFKRNEWLLKTVHRALQKKDCLVIYFKFMLFSKLTLLKIHHIFIFYVVFSKYNIND